MSLAIRACLLSRAINRNSPETSRSTGSSTETNRFVPDLELQSQQNRFREAILNRLISFRVRMQQTRIDNIEREMNVRSRLSRLGSSPATGNNDNRERSSSATRRQSSLSQNRFSPYFPNPRYLGTNRTAASPLNGVSRDVNNPALSESTMNVTTAATTNRSPENILELSSRSRSESDLLRGRSETLQNDPRPQNIAEEPISALARDATINNPRNDDQEQQTTLQRDNSINSPPKSRR